MVKLAESSVYALIMILTALSFESTAATPYPVPEFAVAYVDNSYDVPPSYGVDEFTGKTVIKQEGYHVDAKSVVFIIKNQPFAAYTNIEGDQINLYFNFRYKGHFGTEWRYYPFSDTGYGTIKYSCTFFSLTDETPEISQSSDDYTEKAFPLSFLFSGNTPTSGDEVDFQVQTLVGHIDYEGDGYYSFSGEYGSWSDVASLKVGSSQVTVAPSVSPPPINANDTYYVPPSYSDWQTDDDYYTRQTIQPELQDTVDWKPFAIAVIVLIVVVVVLSVAALFVQFLKPSGIARPTPKPQMSLAP